MSLPRAALRALGFMVSLVGPAAHAQTPSELGLHVRDCDGGSIETSRELVELVRLELRADGIVRVTSASERAQLGTVLWVEPACDRPEDASFAIGYDDPSQERHLERSLSLADVPIELRERALALALAELFRAGDANTQVASERRAPTESPTATTNADRQPPPAELTPATADADAESTRAAATAHSAAWTLALGPALQVLPASGLAMIGAELAIGWQSASAGVLGNLASDTDRLGDVHYRRLHGFAALDVLSTKPAPIRITAGVRAELGATFTNVKPLAAAVASDVKSASGAIALESNIRWRIAPRWQTQLRLDAGYTLGPRIRADDRELADFSGLYVGAALCVVLALAPDR